MRVKIVWGEMKKNVIKMWEFYRKFLLFLQVHIMSLLISFIARDLDLIFNLNWNFGSILFNKDLFEFLKTLGQHLKNII